MPNAGAVAATPDRASSPPAATQRLPGLPGRVCLDWTESRMHVGGALDVAPTRGMLDADGLRQIRRGRALMPTAAGLRHLHSLGVAA